MGTMKWMPLHTPKPEDGKIYDIRLKDGTLVTGVEFWDFGAGFEPLEIDETSPHGSKCVKYPLSVVRDYKPS